MQNDIEQCVLTLLQSDPDPMVPLTRLHASLVAELGPHCGTYAQLHERLRDRPDLFLLLEPLVPWSADNWSTDLQDEYARALREAGLDTGPRVALASPDADPPDSELSVNAAAPVLRTLQASLVHLWACAGDDPQLQAELVEALAQAEEIRRVLEGSPAPPPRADPG